MKTPFDDAVCVLVDLAREGFSRGWDRTDRADRHDEIASATAGIHAEWLALRVALVATRRDVHDVHVASCVVPLHVLRRRDDQGDPMTWHRRDVAAEVSEFVRDGWAERAIRLVRAGDDAASIHSGDHVVFAMRVGDEIHVYDCLCEREQVIAYKRSPNTPKVRRARRRGP